MNWKTIAIVIAIVVAVNIVSYIVASRALAQPAVNALPDDGGPTGRR